MANFSLGDAELTTSVDLKGLNEGLREAESSAAAKGESAGRSLGAGLAAGVAAAGAAVALAVGAVLATAVGFAAEQAQGVNMLQAQLGLTADEAAELGGVAEDVFLNNFGGSIGEATEAVGLIRQQLGDMPGGELQAVTEGALSIADAFGEDVSSVVGATKTLMEEFGMTGPEALDMITTGMQNGLNASGDYLDSITEYGPQFSNAGATGAEMYSLLASGAAEGTLGVDKAADAFKEFTLRIADGSDSSREALAAIGVNADTLWSQMASGEVTTAQAFETVIAGLNGIDDPLLRNQVGVSLLGTQYEDLGSSAVLGLSLATTSMADMGGATDSLGVQYNNLGAVWETASRQMLVTIAPLGEILLQIANMAMPHLLAAFEQLRAGIEIAIAVATSVVTNGVTLISGLLSGQGTSSVNNWGAAYDQVKNLITSYITTIQSVINTIVSAITAFWQQNGESIKSFTASAWQQIGSIITLAMQLIQAIVVPLWTAIAGFISDNQATIVAVLTTAWENIKTVVQAALTIVESVIKIALAAIKGDWSTVWENIKLITSTIIEAVKTVVGNNIALMQGIVNGVLDALKTKFSEVWEGIKTAVTTNIEAAKASVSTTIEGMKTTVVGVLNDIKGSFTETFAGILEGITGLAGRASAAGSAFIDSIRSGVMGAIGRLISDARARLQELADLLPGSEPKDPTSPLRGLAARGEAIALNMIPGFNSGMGELTGAMRDGLSAAADTTVKSTEINLTAQYGYQPERRLRDDVRLLQLMSNT